MSRRKVSSRTAKFFKIWVEDFKHRLPIPPAFEECMDGVLGSRVTLIGPTGTSCQVEVERADSGLYLQKGWQDFVDYHSVQLCELLIFRYNGKLRFDVEIFDKTACEKKETSYIKNPEGASKDLGEQSKVSDKNEERMYNISNKSKRENMKSSREPEATESFKKIHPYFLRTLKPSHIDSRQYDMAKSVPSNEKEVTRLTHNTESNCTKKRKRTEEIMIDLENPNPKPVQHIQYAKIREYPQGQEVNAVATAGENNWCPRWFMSNRRPITNEEKAKAIKAAQAFKSTYPSFTIALSTSYVYQKCPLAIPTNFAKNHLPRENQDITLRNSSGETWSVRYTCKSYAVLSRGWVTFVMENNLEEGDVCVFQLVERAPVIVIKVTIFRVVEEVVPLTPGTKKGRPRKRP